MKILAENRISINKSLFMEGLLRISRDSYGKSARKAALVLLALWVALLIFTVAVKGSLQQTAGVLIPVAFVCLWILVVMPRSNAKKAWKAQAAKFGNPMERRACFYGEYMTVQGDCVDTTIAYSDICQIKRSRRLMILVTRDNVGVMLALNGFKMLTATQVEALILSKEMET